MENNLDLKDIDIVELFKEIGYSLYGNDDRIIKFENAWYQIHFYTKTRTYYSEDHRYSTKLAIDYCMNNFDKLIEVNNER